MTTESQQNYNNTAIDEISLKELILKIAEWWRYLLSKWLLILIFGILGSILGFYYAYLKKPIYVANTTFVLEEAKGDGGLGSLAGLASVAGIDVGSGGGGIFQGENILELYKSRNMIEKALLTKVEINGQKKLLLEQYISFNKIREKWLSNPKLQKIKIDFEKPSTDNSISRIKDSLMGSFVEDIRNNYLSVAKPDKKLSIIKAEVKATNEIFAKAFNEQIVATVNDFYIQTKTKKSVRNVNILKQKSDSVRAVMNGAIFIGASILDATPNLNPTRQVQRTVPIQRSQFTTETNKAILTELLQNLEITRMSLLKETPLIQVVDGPILPLKIEKSSKLMSLFAGGFLLGFLTILGLILSKIYKEIISND